MFKIIITKIIKKRHFWRYASFSEIAELYTSRMLRIVAMNLGGGFASVYLYQFGYELSQIFLFWTIFYIFRLVIMPVLAHFIAYYGPKHGIFISNLLYIPAMIALAIVPTVGFAAIVFWGLFMAISSSLYVLCYYIDFSKVKSTKNTGREIGFMAIIEKLALAASPIVGGLLAIIFEPQFVMWIAAAVIALAALPLMTTAEPTHTHQKINYKGFPWRLVYRSYRSELGVGYDVIASGTVWTLYLSVVVFGAIGDSIYLNIGMLSGATVVVGLTAAYVYGKIVNGSRGRELLFYSAMLNAVTHSLRPFVSSPVAALGINISNETATTGVSMSRLKGVFDIADKSGHRIVYLMGLEAASLVGAIVACLTMVVLLETVPQKFAFIFFYVIAAPVVMTVATAGFPVYKR